MPGRGVDVIFLNTEEYLVKSYYIKSENFEGGSFRPFCFFLSCSSVEDFVHLKKFLSFRRYSGSSSR